MIPSFPQFKPLELEDRLIIERKLRSTSRQICELSLGNIFIWKYFDHTRLTCLHDNICMLITPANEEPYFLEPIGKNQPVETITELLQKARISRVSKGYLSSLPAGSFTAQPLRNQFDYIYNRSDLAELKGKKYDGKRNHLKRFKKSFPDYLYQPLDLEMQKQALALFEKWFAVRSESKFFPRLAYTSQREALVQAFANFKELRLLGGALISDHRLLGFTIGSKINPEMISVHFLYVDPSAPGCSQTLLWEACNKTYSVFKLVNLEQDLGIPGIRTAKLSYHPLRLEEKFEIKSVS
jgi:hypothetical protein